MSRRVRKPRAEWRDRWEAYEARKAELTEQALSPTEYEDAVRAIAKELGV